MVYISDIKFPNYLTAKLKLSNDQLLTWEYDNIYVK